MTSTRRQIDRSSTEYFETAVAWMSDEALREAAAKQRGFFGVFARRELARRDLEVGLAE